MAERLASVDIDIKLSDLELARFKNALARLIAKQVIAIVDAEMSLLNNSVHGEVETTGEPSNDETAPRRSGRDPDQSGPAHQVRGARRR
jgi:hypothetical protein